MRWILAGLVVLVVAGCGDDGGASTRATTQITPASPLEVRVSELESGIGEYCEKLSSGGASAADDRQAAEDVRELIALARREPGARKALEETSVTLEADCSGSPLGRRVDRALRR